MIDPRINRRTAIGAAIAAASYATLSGCVPPAPGPKQGSATSAVSKPVEPTPTTYIRRQSVISTRNLARLPEPKRLMAAYQSMALLDAIIEPEWWLRYFSFDFGFSPDRTISLGSMQNGSGDYLHAIFGPSGCLIHGFAHEYPMTPYANKPPRVFPGVVDQIPKEFASQRAALHEEWWNEMVTFCIWRREADDRWHLGDVKFGDDPDPDGSGFLLSHYDGRPESYHAWAEDYYEPRKLDLAAIKHVFAHRPLTEEIVRTLNPARSMKELADEVREIGYP